MKSKRYLVFSLILITIITFISFNINVNANSNLEVLINNRKVNVRKVDVLVDNKPLVSEVPSFIQEDRTLVPVRFIAETYGAEVSWDKDTQTAIVKHGEDLIELPIDKDFAKKNGQAIELDFNSIPRLVQFNNGDARTMVPLAFISEALGYDYGYDKAKKSPYILSKKPDVKPETPVEKPVEKPAEKPVEKPVESTKNNITDISFSKGSSDNNKLLIKSNSNLNVKETSGKGKNISLNIPKAGVSDSLKGKLSKLTDQNIKEIKLVEKDNDITFEIELFESKDYIVRPINGGKTISIGFVEKVGSLNEVNGKVQIKNAGKLEKKVMRLSNPDRIVVDFLDAQLENKHEKNLTKRIGYIESVRISDFSVDNNYKPEDNVVRVVFDITDGNQKMELEYEEVDGNLMVIPEDSIWQFIDYNKQGRVANIRIDNGKITNYKINNATRGKVIEISIPKDKTNLKPGEIKINDGLVTTVEAKEVGNELLLLISYLKTVDYEVQSSDNTDNIKLKLIQDSNVKPEDRIIVLDAGHGGKDPGTSSPNGTREKDIALSVTLKLEDKLKGLGYSVITTRDTDEYIGLYDRANVANDNSADVFVSIHANSVAGNQKVSGIETLYCPKGRGKNKKEDQYPLAKLIQDNLIKQTGAVNRGVKPRPDLAVLNSTHMPAVLVETGFLTNSAEEAKLKDNSYQNSLAQAIADGIKEYLEMY